MSATFITEQTVENLIEQYKPLVKRIVHHMLMHLPADIQRDDLLQAGMLGLVEAAKRYDPEKGASFETYAKIRIRGMILDEIREEDWLPRSVHRNVRYLADIIHHLENQLGREPHNQEIATAMSENGKQYDTMLSDKSATQLFSLDDVANHEWITHENELTSMSDPFCELALRDFYQVIVSVIGTLPEREQLVLSLYYDEGLSLREIGEKLNVSESRISQIRSQAMVRLHTCLEEWKNS